MSKCAEILRLRLILPLAAKLMGLRIVYWYKQICKMNTWSKEQVKNWQSEHLQYLVNHVYNHTVYYRNLFDSCWC